MSATSFGKPSKLDLLPPLLLIMIIRNSTVPRLLESPPPSPTLGTREETFVPNSATVTDDDAVLLSVDKITPYLDASLKALGLHTEARTSFITWVFIYYVNLTCLLTAGTGYPPF